MKAISVKQPYSSLIESGLKPIEYRTWRISYRGPLLIVASKTFHESWDASATMVSRESYPLGCAVCVVDLHDITGEPGAYEWHVRNPRSVERVPVRGYAAMYSVPDKGIRYVKAMPEIVSALRKAAKRG